MGAPTPAAGTVGDGLVLIDKPAGWTSHDVVARMRRLAGTRKVGHAGTLDPMATGLLVLGVNRATRLLTYLVGADKTYTAIIRLGQDTSTDDAEGEVTTTAGAGQDVPERLPAAMADLRGPIAQRPSAVSAIKVDGRRAYARVRAGEDVQLEARQVQVTEFVTTGELAFATASDGTAVLDIPVRVTCSSGTYIRALARDLGAALGTGGHLTALRRTRVGVFELDAAQPLGEPGQDLDVLSVSKVATRLFPVQDLTDEQVRAVRYGQRISVPAPSAAATAEAVASGGEAAQGEAVQGEAVQGEAVQGEVAQREAVQGEAAQREAPVAARTPDGTVIALLRPQGGELRPVLVFDPA